MPREPTPVIAEAIRVDVSDGPVSPRQTAAPAAVVASAEAALPSPPAPPSPLRASSAPPLASVALPIAAVAFATPAQEPERIIDARQAAPTTPIPAPSAVPQKLTFGRGEGRQPAPEYPREAVLARVQGTVVVRFTVNVDGRVQAAEAAVPCASALLNQAAVRAVRESWRFPPGAARNYEVAVQFQLNAK